MKSDCVQQESQQHSFENLYAMGPILQQSSTQQYYKRSSSIISVPSDSQEITNRFADNYQQSQRKLKLLKQKESMRRFKTKQQPNSELLKQKNSVQKISIDQQVSESFLLAKHQMTNLISMMVRNRYIKQFKSNLFLNSYVLPEEKKNFLYSEKYLQENKSQNAYKNAEKRSQYIFQPGSKVILILDIYIIVIQILSLWFGPLISSFQNIFSNQNILSIIIFLSIILEIFISLNRAIIIQGEIILDRRIIIRQYIQSQLYYDIIMVIMWLFYSVNMHQYIVLNELIAITSSIVNMKKLAQNYYYQIEYFYLKGGFNNLIDLMTLIILIGFYAHFMACLWHYIGNLHSEYEMTWLIKYNLIDSSMWIRYNYSFYWSTVTMVTIGYGDITPQNSLEIIFSSVMILISSCVYAYLMNSIGILLKHINDTKFKYRKQMSLVSQFMNNNYVNQNIQARVKNYLQNNIYNEKNENQEEVDFLLTQLPETLKAEMISEIQQILVNKIVLLKQNFSKNLLKLLSQNIKRFRFSPGDRIFAQNDAQEKNLYFIIEGKVELQEENSKKTLYKIDQNQCFGEYTFFTGFPPKVSAFSKGYTEVAMLSRECMLESLIGFQKDRERFHMMKDTILLDNSFASIFLKCNFCGKFNHQSIDCRMISYKPDIEQRIKKMLYKTYQDRKTDYKRHSEKCNSLLAQFDVNESITKYCQEKNLLEMSENIQSVNSTTNNKNLTNEIEQSTNRFPNYESQDFQVFKMTKVNTQSQFYELNKLSRQPSFSRNDKKQKTNTFNAHERQSIVELQIPTTSLQKQEELFLEILNVPLQFHSTIIDCIKQYKYYYPQQNATEIIKLYNQLISNSNSNSTQSKFQRNSSNAIKKHCTNYTFNFDSIRKIMLTKNK